MKISIGAEYVEATGDPPFEAWALDVFLQLREDMAARVRYVQQVERDVARRCRVRELVDELRLLDPTLLRRGGPR